MNTHLHVDLKPYPFPEGMAIPRLMPFQTFPWNGDGYLAAEVLRLKEAHNIMSAIETGTCLGSTMIWLGEQFAAVDTVEVNDAFRTIAQDRGLAHFENNAPWITSHAGESVEMLKKVSAGFYFLDAHWGEHCPLLDELDAIAAAKVKPCIIIHDFQVPGTDFGFDRMPDGRPFDLDLIRAHLDRIYGEGGWRHTYPTQIEGAKRGWISIEPANP